MVRPIRLQEYSHLGGPDFLCFPHGDKICRGESTLSILCQISDIYICMFDILFQHVLSSTTLTYKYDPYNLLYPWLGRGLLTANGHQWMLRRKLITPSFHFRILRDFLQIMNETSGRFMSLLERESDKAQSQVLDMQELVSRNTIDVICGRPYESLFNCLTSNQNQPQRLQWVPESTVLKAKHLPLWPPSTRSAT